MNRSRGISPFVLGLISFFLLNISFFGMNYWKRGTFNLSPLYVELLVTFYFIWLFVSLFTKKFRFDFSRRYQALMLLLIRSTIYMVYCLALMVVFVGLRGFSRIHIFGTCGLLFVTEVVVFSVYYISSHKTNISYAGWDAAKPKVKLLPVLLVGDFVLVTFVFLIVNYFKRGTFGLSNEYEKLLLIIYGSWFVSALMTRKFNADFRNYYFAMAQWTKAVVFMCAIMAVLVFAFELFYYSRFQIVGFFIILMFSESVLYFVYYVLTGNGKNGGDIESVEEIKTIIKQDALNLDIDIDELRLSLTSPIRNKLHELYLKNFPRTFDFLDQTLDLSRIIRAETTIVNSREMYHLKTIDEHPTRLFINTERINNIRRVNRYFLEVHKMLLPSGYFVGRANTIDLYRKWFFEKYPKYFAQIFYFANFIFRRVFPKLTVTQKVYFTITKGANRAISRAETMGRLCFCGFKIIATREIGNDFYFIAQKVKTSSADQSPSYGPLVRLSRMGLNGNVINTYKFRTMHPYSEYLQEYIHEKNNLQQGGKFKDDFRVTTIGKFMRRTWLDELPMLYNWIKGELNLVGVRPLSFHYFNLYPKDLQELRKRVVPGLIPPFYADLPTTFDEICESERRYIESYLKKPMRIKWLYFWKAINNIVLNGVRSG